LIYNLNYDCNPKDHKEIHYKYCFTFNTSDLILKVVK